MDAQHSPTPAEVFYARTFWVATLLVVGLALYRILWPLMAPIVWAIFIAFLLSPLQRALVRRLRCRASLTALLLTLATLLTLVGPLTALGAAFAAQLDALLNVLREMADSGAARGDITQMPAFRQLLGWLQEALGVSPEQIRQWMEQAGAYLMEALPPLGGKIFLGALGRALAFALTMFMLFFFLRDGARVLATVRALIPMPEREKSRLFRHLAEVTRAVVYGTGLTALMQGVLVGIGFALLGLPAPVVFGALAVLAALIPAAGTPLVWVPAVIALALQQRWGAAVFMLAWGVMVSTVDNVVRPVLVSGRANIGTLAVFIGVLGGIFAFGAVGLLLGPFVLALVFALIRFALERRHATPLEKPENLTP